MFTNAISLFPIGIVLLLTSSAFTQIQQPPGRGIGVSTKRLPETEPLTVDVPLVPPARPAERAVSIDPKEKKLVEPDAADLTAYRDVLRKPGYRIVKLLDPKCPAGASSKVVDLSDGCLHTIAGNGAVFSFRRREYTSIETSDLKIVKGKFVAGSVFTQGLIVSLGNIDIEKVDLDADGVNYLTTFEPASDCEEAKHQTTDLNRGMVSGRFRYSSYTEIRPNETLVLRSIAYRVPLQVEDKRRDIIVALKVVRQDDDGNVTLIWKELQNKESPKIRIGK